MKKMLLFIFVILTGCGVSQSDYDKIKSTNDSLSTVVNNLKNKVDELENGEPRLIGLAKNSYSNKKYIDALKYINTLFKKHPESSEIVYFKTILPEIEKKAAEEKAVFEKQKKDSIRLANINNLGIWKIRTFVDEFGENTKEKYITTKVGGTFSNSATENSSLIVDFIIENKENIAIQLYEYSSNNPVKDDGLYTVMVQDKNGNRYRLNAFNHSDRLILSDSQYYDKTGNKVLEKSHALMLWKILANGGNIKFRIENLSYANSIYNFSIKKADWIENAYLKIGGKID